MSRNPSCLLSGQELGEGGASPADADRAAGADAPEPVSASRPLGSIPDAKEVNAEAWTRNAVGFIRERGLTREFSDWCGGWPVPVLPGPQWEPIDTAPWRGPPVLLWKESTKEHYVAARVNGEFGPGWCTPDGFEIFRATHWQPLPAPPAQAMSAGTDETLQAAQSRSDASAVAESDAPEYRQCEGCGQYLEDSEPQDARYCATCCKAFRALNTPPVQP